MKSAHDEMRELLPDYLSGSIAGDLRNNIRAHVDNCPDCKAELLFLSDVMDADRVPDPGELYFKTLPQKVRASVKKKEKHVFSFKTLLMRPVALAASIAVITLAVYLFKDKKGIEDAGLLFKDPLAVSLIDYSTITEKDILITDGQLDIDASTLGFKGIGHGYYIDIASLSSEELEGLSEAMKKAQGNGG